MRPTAIICTRQEADIIGWTVRHLIRQGCDVVVLDCQSTDGTVEAASNAGATIVGYHAPPVSWHAMLRRVEELAADCRGWVIHCDADELRYAWGPEKLTEAFARIQALGYNAVDHQVLTFHPVASGFDGTQDPEEYFPYYSIDNFNSRIGQIKAWRYDGRVDLATSGGHSVRFPGRQVYPSRFLSKHYPIRSQAHGERKVFGERHWKDPEEGRRDWHVQYAGIRPGYSFLKDPRFLNEWKEADIGKG